MAYRTAVTENYNVVVCMSPLFYFERWQIMLLALETYIHFGVDMQVYYIQSMLSTVWNVLKVTLSIGDYLFKLRQLI